MPGEAADAAYLVVVKREDDSSLHATDGGPAGWRDADARDASLAPIGVVWTGTKPGFRTTEPAARSRGASKGAARQDGQAGWDDEFPTRAGAGPHAQW